MRDICKYLDGKDEKALKQAAWEKKASLLLAITENYEMSIANKMRLAADRIQLKLLPEMKKYKSRRRACKGGTFEKTKIYHVGGDADGVYECVYRRGRSDGVCL